jgi:hypothetical protein
MIRYNSEHTLNEGEHLYSKEQAHMDGTKEIVRCWQLGRRINCSRPSSHLGSP